MHMHIQCSLDKYKFIISYAVLNYFSLCFFLDKTLLFYHCLFICYQDDICYETRKTAVTVQAFPKNLTIFEERTREKKCDSFPRCNEEPLVYHCVRSKDGIVEVCAPRRVIKGMYVFL